MTFSEKQKRYLIGFYALAGGNINVALNMYKQAFNETLDHGEAILKLSLSGALIEGRMPNHVAKNTVEGRLALHEAFILRAENFDSMRAYLGITPEELVRMCIKYKIKPEYSPPELVIPKRKEYKTHMGTVSKKGVALSRRISNGIRAKSNGD